MHGEAEEEAVREEAIREREEGRRKRDSCARAPVRRMLEQQRSGVG